LTGLPSFNEETVLEYLVNIDTIYQMLGIIRNSKPRDTLVSRAYLDKQILGANAE
jgi:hypothetical protein